MQRMIVQAIKYWHTLRYLKQEQIFGRLKYRLMRPKPDFAPAPALRIAKGLWVKPANRKPSLTGPGTFRFLNLNGELDHVGWHGGAREKLWRYNQHYFDDLNARGAEHRREWHIPLIADWVAQNRPAAGSGWEPYPTSLRIVNWTKWVCSGGLLDDAALQSLVVQIRWLTCRLEHHLLGNHLFANAKALIFAGCLFEGREPDMWLKLGFDILNVQFSEQILSDGGQFELSPMYHALALEDVLDLINITTYFSLACNRTQRQQVAKWQSVASDMIEWLRVMSHPDGEIAFFNDSSISVAPSPSELTAYAARLNVIPHEIDSAVSWLKVSGYIRISTNSAVLIADVGRIGPNYLPAHAHADTLSFELSLNGRRIIVNSGTSIYGISAERIRQRGTEAHSTVMIDGLDSSEVWSGFRVARRAFPKNVLMLGDAMPLRVFAAHDGYARLKGKPIHSRSWALDHDCLTIADRVTGGGQHRLDIMFYLAPSVDAKHLPGGDIQLLHVETRAIIATIHSETMIPITIEPATWHPEFGLSINNKRLRIRLDAELPVAHNTYVCWTTP